MKIQPINQYTIVKLDPANEKLGNGTLYAPGVVMEKYDLPKRSGTVRANGRGLITAGGELIPPQTKAGDRVWLLDLSDKGKPFMEFDYNGEKCVILPSEDLILGIITEEDAA